MSVSYTHLDVYKRQIERFAGHLTDILFTQSAEDAHTAVAEKIISAERVQAIGNGVDASRFEPKTVGTGKMVRDALGIPAHAFVVGLIGRQVREKGVACLLYTSFGFGEIENVHHQSLDKVRYVYRCLLYTSRCV